jgi:hypothetical protein
MVFPYLRKNRLRPATPPKKTHSKQIRNRQTTEIGLNIPLEILDLIGIFTTEPARQTPISNQARDFLPGIGEIKSIRAGWISTPRPSSGRQEEDDWSGIPISRSAEGGLKMYGVVRDSSPLSVLGSREGVGRRRRREPARRSLPCRREGGQGKGEKGVRRKRKKAGLWRGLV